MELWKNNCCTAVAAVLGCAWLSSTTRAVQAGDEAYGDDDYGKFWVFHSQGVSVVNPDTCAVEITITEDGDGNALPTRWYDGVFIELPSPPQHQGNQTQGYIGINSAIPYDNDVDGQSTGAGEVLILSTNGEDRDQPIVSRIVVGPRPVHAYAVKIGNQIEYWAHSDQEGQFYIVDLKDVRKRTQDVVQAFVEKPAHGELMWDTLHLQMAGPNATAVGFGTSILEPYMFVFDMIEKTIMTTYDFSNATFPETCSGSHSISYSEINQHVYLECTGGGGILEINVADPLDPSFVAQFLEAGGALTRVPLKDFRVASTSKEGNALYIFTPNSNGEASTVTHVVNVPGHPDTPSFWTDGEWNDTVCMPLTENANINNRNAAGEIVCDFYGCSGATSELDVASGRCLYDASGINLLTVDSTQNDSIVAEEEPFNSACKYCETSENYDNESGLCTCTPGCGLCAEAAYDTTNTGYRCFNWTELLNSAPTTGGLVSKAVTTALLIKQGGAVLQGSPNVSSPECGFGETFRPHKRGYIYDASIANIPEDSLVILNMKTEKVQCSAALPGTPTRVIYVPTRGAERIAFIEERNPVEENVNGVNGWYVFAGVAALSVLAVAVVFLGGKSKKNQDEHQHDNDPPNALVSTTAVVENGEAELPKDLDAATQGETSGGDEQQPQSQPQEKGEDEMDMHWEA
ncbi:hypothetical protein ACA910_002920 [Epithemia clementina (nom. ined.)]